MVQLDIVKGEIEETLILNSFDKALELLRTLTGGKDYNSIHKNRMVFGEGKDTIIISTTNIEESTEQDIKDLIAKVKASKLDTQDTQPGINVGLKALKREQAIEEFKKEYNKYAISLAYKALLRDINFSEIRERVISQQPLNNITISQNSCLLTLRGFKEYIGLQVLTQPSNGFVGVSILKDLRMLVNFIDNEFKEASIKDYKNKASKSLSILPESATLPGVSNIPEHELISGVISSENILSKDNLEFLHTLGFKDGKYGVYYPVNYYSEVPLPVTTGEATVVKKNMGAFGSINNISEEDAKKIAANKNGLLKFRQSVLRYISANYLYKAGMGFFPNSTDRLSENFYKFNLYDEYRDIQQALISIRIKITEGRMEVANGIELQTIHDWVQFVCTQRDINSIYAECADKLKGLISDNTMHWLMGVIERNYNSKRALTSFELLVGDNIPEDFLQVIKGTGASIIDNGNSEKVLKLG